MFSFDLSPSDLANLVLQRTDHFLQLGGLETLKHWRNTGEKAQLAEFLAEQNKTQSFIDAVTAEIAAEFELLRPHISQVKPETYVSVGCGMGIFELMVFKECGPLQLKLIDIEQTPEHQHMFAKTGSGYASLEATRNFLASNGVEASHVKICNPRKQPLPSGRFDMLTSLISMGFHYPCDEYADFIRKGLRKHGLFIVDKRKGVADAGWDVLVPLFNVVAMFSKPNSDRLILRRK